MVNDGDENIPWPSKSVNKNHPMEQIQVKETQPRYDVMCEFHGARKLTPQGNPRAPIIQAQLTLDSHKKAQ